MKPERISEIDGQPLELWRQHLLDAAAYIEEHGYCKNRCRADDGRVCVIGAIIHSHPCAREVDFETAEAQVLRHLQLPPDGVFFAPAIAKWNDRPETTKEMAVNALIGAALSK